MQFNVNISATTVLDDYTFCKANGFGRTLLVCDVDDSLSWETQQKLVSLLYDLQQKVECECERGCERPDGDDRFICVWKLF